MIRSASDLIDLEHPNYQFVAARLLLFSIRKQLYGRRHEIPKVKNHISSCVERGVYDPELLTLYSDEEFDKLQSFIDHDRDYLFSTIFVVAPPGVVAGDTINVTIGGVAGQTIASVAATSVTLNSTGGISTISVAVAKDSRIQFSNDNLVSLASTISNAVSITDQLYFQRKSGGYDRIVYGISETTSALYDGDTSKYRTEGGGWVGVQTYMDMHGNLRVKSETLVATSGIQTGIHGIGYPTAENG